MRSFLAKLEDGYFGVTEVTEECPGRDVTGAVVPHAAGLPSIPPLPLSCTSHADTETQRKLCTCSPKMLKGKTKNPAKQHMKPLSA